MNLKDNDLERLNVYFDISMKKSKFTYCITIKISKKFKDANQWREKKETI